MGSNPLSTDDALDALVARAQQGDRVALEGVLARVAPAVYRFGLRMCRNAHDAEDVLQDTLLNITGHLREFEGRSSLSSWVFALTRSACTRKRRGFKNQPPIGEGLAEQTDRARSPEAHAADQEIAVAVLESRLREHEYPIAEHRERRDRSDLERGGEPVRPPRVAGVAHETVTRKFARGEPPRRA